MANSTVYPYGTGGSLPSSIGIINDLTTGGADKALAAEQGKVLNGKLSQLSLDVDGVAYNGSFTIPATGEHSSNSDRITFPTPIPAGTYTLLISTGSTGNTGNCQPYVKYVGASSTTSLGSTAIGTAKSVTFTGAVESIGIYMSATVNKGTGLMPLTISTDANLSSRVESLEDSMETVAPLAPQVNNREFLAKSLVRASDGAIVTNNNYTTLATPFIILGDSDLTLSYAYQSGTSSLCCFYDASGRFISSYSVTNNGYQAVTVPKSSFPSGAVYARSTIGTGCTISGDIIDYEALRHLTGNITDEVERLKVKTVGYVYSDSFTISAIGEHSSNSDRITFPNAIPAGKYSFLVESGTTGNSGGYGIYVKYEGDDSTTRIDSGATIGTPITLTTTKAMLSIGIHMGATVNTGTGSMPLTITAISLDYRVEALEDAIDVDGTSIFTLNPDRIVKQKLTQLTRETTNISTGSIYADSVVTFLHFSDIHGQQTNLERIIEFGDKYGSYLDDIVSSGDQITALYSDSFTFWGSAGAQKVLLALGNHEVWKDYSTKETDPQSASDCYTKFIAPNIAQWGVTSPGTGLCYYYKDYNATGSYPLRFIVIDCVHVDQAQTTWFTNVLADAKTNGYTVVVMSHYSPSILANVQFDDDSTFTCVEGSRSWTGYGTVAPLELLVKDFVDGGGKFACWLCGHLHWDMFGLSEHGQPIICVECATTQRTDRYDARVIGTKTQDAFNIISFDCYKGVLRVLRIGNDIDRLMRPKETLCFDYINKAGIYNC